MKIDAQNNSGRARRGDDARRCGMCDNLAFETRNNKRTRARVFTMRRLHTKSHASFYAAREMRAYFWHPALRAFDACVALRFGCVTRYAFNFVIVRIRAFCALSGVVRNEVTFSAQILRVFLPFRIPHCPSGDATQDAGQRIPI